MADIKTQKVEDLKKVIADKREALRVFRFGESGSRLRNVRAGRNLKREIAQMMTEIRSRELEVIKKAQKEVAETLKNLKKVEKPVKAKIASKAKTK